MVIEGEQAAVPSITLSQGFERVAFASPVAPTGFRSGAAHSVVIVQRVFCTARSAKGLPVYCTSVHAAGDTLARAEVRRSITCRPFGMVAGERIPSFYSRPGHSNMMSGGAI